LDSEGQCAARESLRSSLRSNWGRLERESRGNKNWQWQKYIPDDRTGTDLSGNSGLRNVV
jgi:hypothetical protein